jgi:LmbE family N-acetylglucosaminyl deacetylase
MAMRKRIFPVLLTAIFFVSSARTPKAYPAFAAASAAAKAGYAIPAIGPIQQDDRILILAPHPDDETIGCAGIIQEALRRSAKVHVVYLTNGDSNELAFIVYEKRLTFRRGEFLHMGEVRRKEATRAMEYLGLNAQDVTFLGYPDFGTFAIFMAHWQDAKPYKGLFTRSTSVPYKENLSYGAPYKGESILEDIKSLIKKYQPNKIFVSHPADTNADHKALYLFLQIALSELYPEGAVAPKVYPYLIHCIGWPSPRHYHPELWLSPPEHFLDSQVAWSQCLLSLSDLEKKHQAVLLYKSQTESSAFYLLCFARKNELFGDYPSIELKVSAPGAEPRGQKVQFVGTSNMYNDVPLGLIDTLQEAIEGKGHVSYGMTDNCLLIRIDKTKEISRHIGFLVYLFGYSDKVPFGEMPKIRISVKSNNYRVFNAKKMIKPERITLEYDTKKIILKVPLKLLGDPDYIFSSLKTFRGILPIDTAAFRKIKIK